MMNGSDPLKHILDMIAGEHATVPLDPSRQFFDSPLSGALGGGSAPGMGGMGMGGGFDSMGMKMGPMAPGATDQMGGPGPTVFPPSGLRQAPQQDSGFLALLVKLLQGLGARGAQHKGRSFAGPTSDR